MPIRPVSNCFRCGTHDSRRHSGIHRYAEQADHDECPNADRGNHSKEREDGERQPYAAFVQDYLTTLRSGTEFTTPEDVADAVLRAVTEKDAPMKTPAGADARKWFREAGHTVD